MIEIEIGSSEEGDPNPLEEEKGYERVTREGKEVEIKDRMEVNKQLDRGGYRLEETTKKKKISRRVRRRNTCIHSNRRRRRILVVV